MTSNRSWLRVAVTHGVYGLLVHLACLLALPPWLVRMARDRRQVRWILGRFGRLPPGVGHDAPIWIHAVSVGEAKAARPLVERLQRDHPHVPLVLSNGTLTGHDTTRRLFPDLPSFSLPLDLPWVVARVLDRLSPRALVLIELEVWPALLRAADRRGIPVIMLNGRVSEPSFRSYRRWSWFLPEFDRLALVAAQDEIHAGRIEGLGVPADRIHVTGNLKHDGLRSPDPEVVERLRRTLALDDRLPVFVAGSTHDGEDRPVVEAWLAAGGSQVAQLVLVPRHLDRLGEITRLLGRLEVPWVLRSSEDAGRRPEQVLLVDTMGELEAFFGLADVVFLGGSLVPVGGHNVLEPAAAGCPLLTGPHLASCTREADLLRGAGAQRVVADGRELARELGRILEDRQLRSRMAGAALEAVTGLAGAARADIALLESLGLLQPVHDANRSDNVSRSPSSPSSRTGAPSP